MPEPKPLSTLRTWPDNYNRNDVRKIARSILLYGFNGALRVWRDEMVIAGNHTLEALRLLKTLGYETAVKELELPGDREYSWPPANVEAQGEEWLVPWVDTSHLEWDEAKAFAIADNNLARQATPVPELLAKYLAELLESDPLLVQATGFSPSELNALLAALPSPDAAPDPGPQTDRPEELLAKWKTERGQLWEIPSQTVAGRCHRLLCGDSTDSEDVTRLMAGERATLFATDPPYLVDYDGTNHPHKWNEADKNKDWSESYEDWDDAAQGEDLYDGFVRVALEVAIVENAAWYCWHASRNQAMLEQVWERHGAFVHQQIVWVKDRPVLTRSWYMWQHEPCFFGWVRGQKPDRAAEDYPATVWEFPTVAPGTSTDHPTSKPVELFAIPMRQHTVPGQICYEPFSGSGSQIVAGEQLGRLVYAMELQPVFVAAALERLALMGLEPRLGLAMHEG